MNKVFRTRRLNNQIARMVITPVEIIVMNLFTRSKRAPDLLFRNQDMFVDIPAYIGTRVTGALDQHVSVLRYRSAAFPVRIALKR